MLGTANKIRNEWEFEIVKKARKGREPNKNGKAIRVREHKNGHKNGNKQGASVSVLLSEELMKKARFMVGDKGLLGVRIVDGRRQIMIKRSNDNENAYTMSANKEFAGQSKACSIKVIKGGAMDDMVGFECDIDSVDFDSVIGGVVASE